MSYEINLLAPTGAGDGIRLEVGEITGNLRSMFKAALPGDLSLPGLHGMDCKSALVPLRVAIDVMKRRPDGFRQMNPPSGWGDSGHALLFLEKLTLACALHPNAVIEVLR